jgi:hypothetical protein
MELIVLSAWPILGDKELEELPEGSPGNLKRSKEMNIGFF